MKLSKISLKYKLLVLLVSLPLTSLALYLLLAVKLFESDKIAYVLDSTATAARSLSSRTRMEMDQSIGSLTKIVEGVSSGKNSFNQILQSQFYNEPSFASLTIYAWNTEKGVWISTQALNKDVKISIPQGKTVLSDMDLLKKAATEEIAFDSAGNDAEEQDWSAVGWIDPKLVSGVRYGAVARIKTETLKEVFSKVTSYQAFLGDGAGRVLFGPEKEGMPKDFSSWKFFQDMKTRHMPEGAVQVRSPDGQDLLVSFSSVGKGGLMSITIVKREDALRAVDILIWKSVLFFVALISFSVIASVFASGQLTSTLRELATATQKISEGDFTIQVAVKSGDEVGMLGQSFNTMAKEISRLMSETADKARMEKELETAKTVQETLFPESDFAVPGFELKGYYLPASECGGDWWYYSKIENKVFIWIGDATGHGAPAALITSAARSAASVIESFQEVTPSLAMRYLNQAIYKTSKGRIMMTFFIASIDLDTGELTYCSASHDPPFLLRKKDVLEKSDFEPLNEVNSPRLGEEPDFEYSEAKLTMGKGDSILFYTDGVPDVLNPEGKAWGQKNFIKAVAGALNQSRQVKPAGDIVWDRIVDYRKDSVLPDDVTFVLCSYGIS